ncbi:MAG: type II toxin-antitoxin system HicA family toxin [Acidobacteriota bacterium]
MKSVSGDEFAKVLRLHGWVLMRINGSHHIYWKPGQPAIISVPIHGSRSLKMGLLKALMKIAALTEADL